MGQIRALHAGEQFGRAAAQPEGERVALVASRVGMQPDKLPGCPHKHQDDHHNDRQVSDNAFARQQPAPERQVWWFRFS